MEIFEDIPTASPTTRKVEKEVYTHADDDPEFLELQKRWKRNDEKLLLMKKVKEAEKKRLQHMVEEQEKFLKQLYEKGEISSIPISLRKFKRSDFPVMISYSWTQQSMVEQIRNECLKQGIPMWMDKDNNYDSKGYLGKAIAKEIEKAEIVIFCISQDYEDSHYCQAEAEYAFQLKKIIIPIKIEKEYKATGWLGLYTAGKLYYDFSGNYPFKKKMTELMTWFQRKFEDTQGINQEPDTEDTVKDLQQPPPAVPAHRISPDSVEEKKCEDLSNWMRYVPDIVDLE